jgi:hypothetical protein
MIEMISLVSINVYFLMFCSQIHFPAETSVRNLDDKA